MTTITQTPQEGWRELRAVRERTEVELAVPILIPDTLIAYTAGRRPEHSLPVNRMDGFQVTPGGSEIFLSDPIGKSATVLRVTRNAEDEIVSVSSQYDRRLVATLLERAMPEKEFSQLRASLTGTKLDLNITDAERRYCEDCIKEYQMDVIRGRQLLREAGHVPQGDKPNHGIDKVQHVREAGVPAFIEGDAQALQVSGAWENIAVAAYNPVQQRAGMLYLDAKSTDKQLDDFLTAMQGQGDAIVLHVAGGMLYDNQMMTRVLERIERDKSTLNLASFCPFSEYGSLTICKDGTAYRDMPPYEPPAKEQKPAPLSKEEPKKEGQRKVEKPLGQNEDVQRLRELSMTDAQHAAHGMTVALPGEKPRGLA